MTLEQCRDHVGRAVEYRAHHLAPDETGEHGIINRVTDRYVLVVFYASGTMLATPAEESLLT